MATCSSLWIAHAQDQRFHISCGSTLKEYCTVENKACTENSFLSVPRGGGGFAEKRASGPAPESRACP